MSNRNERLVVSDLDIADFDFATVVCAVFACGTEGRSAHLWSRVGHHLRGKSIVVDFCSADDPDYIENRKHFAEGIDAASFVPLSEFEIVAAAIRTGLESSAGNAVVVDISSMRRSTYVRLLNLLRFDPALAKAKLIFAYSEGEYPESYPARQITGLNSIVGTGGRTNAMSATIACFGLGFDGGAAITMCERIEPDSIWTVTASGGAPNNTTDKRVLAANAELLQNSAVQLSLPSLSFEEPFRNLMEVFTPVSNNNIICVPLGPKPHVVAFALLGMQLSNVMCVEVTSKFATSFKANATGRLCAASIEIIRPPLKSMLVRDA